VLAALDGVTAWFRHGPHHRRAGSTKDNPADNSILKSSWRHSILCAGVLSLFCLMPPSALANGVLTHELGGAIYRDGTRLASLDVACIVFAVIATLLFLVDSRRLRSSRESVALVYVACGIALLGMTRVFYVVVGTGVISIHTDTLEIWSHILFCVAMVVSVCGGMVLSGDKDDVSRLASPRLVRLCWVMSGLATVAVFVTAEPLDESFMAVFPNSFFDSFPMEHLVAFLISAVAILYMVNSVDVDTSLAGASKNGVLIFPLLLAYSLLFSLEHLWELLLEILHLKAVQSMNMAERVEQMIVVLAFLVVTYSSWRLWSVTRKHAGQPTRH